MYLGLFSFVTKNLTISICFIEVLTHKIMTLYFDYYLTIKSMKLGIINSAHMIELSIYQFIYK